MLICSMMRLLSLLLLGLRRMRGGECMGGMGLGFTNPVGTGGVLDVCLCLGGSDVGGVCGEWVGA